VFQVFGWLAGCFISELYLQSLFIQPVNGGSALNLNPFWWMNLCIYLFILLVFFAWHFTKEWVANEKQKRILIEAQLTTELQYLKIQVNPHFLFNTLNNLFSVAQRNNDGETAAGILKLAGLMRYMLYDSSAASVSLEKEVKNIRDYIALNKLRYNSEEVTAEVTVNGNIEGAVIAPMILLPFIENAFKHGVSIEQSTSIFILLEVLNDKIVFTCSNPIANALSITKEPGGIGLENVKRRLQLLYPAKHLLSIDDNGITFTVKLELYQ